MTTEVKGREIVVCVCVEKETERERQRERVREHINEGKEYKKVRAYTCREKERETTE
jgi:hypothetical protein